ncbi:GATA zinc finger domain-containing protein 14 [Drosophila willistoni]|uniref:GATA zinc finger domain-containing protein 14 n=1 Tax=Drosophila willistoni TaxID=7260 RepID=UPI000C26D827|nr:GATA zinc finger domain-containing protein 14 [Drosophila willistoni]
MSALKEDMSLDEYYEQCVVPKPNIPRCYPGVMGGGKKNRQGRRFISYKDQESSSNDSDDEPEKNIRQSRRFVTYKNDNQPNNEDVNMEETDTKFEYNVTNSKQINYEMNNFNEVYGQDEAPNSTQDMPSGSAQWRIQPNNVNRPSGAPPLVPSNVPQFNARNRFANKSNSSMGFRKQWKQKQKQPNHQFRNIQNRLGHGQNQTQQQHSNGMRNAYNAFNYSPQNTNQGQRLPSLSNLLQNIKDHFPHNYSIHINNNSQELSNPNTIGSLINTVSNVSNPHRVQNGGLPMGFSGGRPEGSQNNDFMLANNFKIDTKPPEDLNVYQIASNLAMLLQNVVHKPVHDQQVQNQINFLQKALGNPEPKFGIDITIKPQATERPMYHRFK